MNDWYEYGEYYNQPLWVADCYRKIPCSFKKKCPRKYGIFKGKSSKIDKLPDSYNEKPYHKYNYNEDEL